MSEQGAKSLADRLQDFRVGDTVAGRYRLDREIARAGGGVVFQAEHVFTRRQVVLKVLSAEQQVREHMAERLLREARALNLARHPNVVDVLDAGKLAQGGPYLVMELLHGRPLDGILATREKLSPSDALWLLTKITAAVARMHRLNLVHRDIKPSNVFISFSSTGEEVPKLLDYGTATHRAVPEAQRLTQENTVVGTPEYMAPEQLMGSRVPDPRIDVYGLGVLLYECLTGAIPFEGEFGQILLKAHQGDFRPIEQLEPELPRDLIEIVHCAMNKEPADRFESAGALLGALRAAAVGQTAPQPLLGLSAAVRSSLPEVQSRRRFTRVPYVTPVFLKGSEGQEYFGKCQDVSTGGILVLVPRRVEPHGVVRAKFALPNSGETVEVEVVGKWARGKRGHIALGLEFVDLPDACAEDIHRFVGESLTWDDIHEARRDTAETGEKDF